MGASGSGKSTFMNLIGCLDRPTRGVYRMAGRDVGKLSRDQLARVRGEQIGFVFQGFNLLPGPARWRTWSCPCSTRASPSRAAPARVGSAGARRSLGPARPHPGPALGWPATAGRHRAGAGEPPTLLLADEPTGNLDSRTSVEVMAIFQELNEQGLTVLLVTHEPDIAKHARRIVTFRDGVLLSDVSLSERRLAREELREQTA